MLFENGYRCAKFQVFFFITDCDNPIFCIFFQEVWAFLALLFNFCDDISRQIVQVDIDAISIVDFYCEVYDL